jgi:1,4-alpha-glucan branching enzyme
MAKNDKPDDRRDRSDQRRRPRRTQERRDVPGPKTDTAIATPVSQEPVSAPSSLPIPDVLGDHDIYLFNEGTHHRLYEKLGARLMTVDGVQGGYFALWAPNAEQVSVIGDFNGWRPSQHRLRAKGGSGIWEGFFPGLQKGTLYKYEIISRHGGERLEKADPFGTFHETPPRTASILWDLDYEWSDDDWMATRKQRQVRSAPISIYEMHIGSWRRVEEEGYRFLTYRELAEQLPPYLKELGYTHVELLPVMEHPFYGSWGYQTTGYFAPTSRYGTPQDFMYFVDVLHKNGIGVILDWVPSHFPDDAHGLAKFDGTHLFEHSDPRQGFHPDWKSLIFNYGRNEVRSFLESSAFFWLEKYHADGLRVDAVASMLYLDYSRKEGEWIPNKYGGRENLEAIQFLRRLNEDVYGEHPDVQTWAEESTAWPMVSKPVYLGGLGFGFKWDMGWMHDTLKFFSTDPVHRKFHHNHITFRAIYAWTENFVLPLSHDEVVHGKGSLIGKMPNDAWQRLANLRLLFTYKYAQPGKKLLFMGGEFGQWREWNHDGSLEWQLLENSGHEGLFKLVSGLNKLYRELPALHQKDHDPSGFEWIDCCDTENSVVSFIRRGDDEKQPLVAIFNFTPIPRHNYQIGVPFAGRWRELLNTDAGYYGGSGHGNMGGVEAAPVPHHGKQYTVTLTLPPLAALFLTPESPEA